MVECTNYQQEIKVLFKRKDVISEFVQEGYVFLDRSWIPGQPLDTSGHDHIGKILKIGNAVGPKLIFCRKSIMILF